jgi:hypothetical protein
MHNIPTDFTLGKMNEQTTPKTKKKLRSCGSLFVCGYVMKFTAFCPIICRGPWI